MEKVYVMPISSLPKSFVARLDDADDEWESDYPNGDEDEN